MSKDNKYFVIPFKQVPAKPTYTVWFASWTTVRPTHDPYLLPPYAIGVTKDDKLPPGAIPIASSTKEPPPPPPPLAVSTPAEYKAAFNAWLANTKDE
jgi:hypothetical protein